MAEYLLYFLLPVMDQAHWEKRGSSASEGQLNHAWDHSFNTFAKFSEKLKFFTPCYAHVLVYIRG